MFKPLLFLFTVLILSTAQALQIWHFPAEAVADLQHTRLEDLFETWNPERLKDETLPNLPGEYLEYRHETLMYYFGPFPNTETAAAGQATLNQIRRALIQHNAKFTTSQVTLHTRPVRTASDAGDANVNTILPESSTQEQTNLEHPDDSPPAQGANSGRNVTAFWLSALLILAASGVLLRKTA